MNATNINPLFKETIVFRPIFKGSMLRYAEGQWLRDDGHTPDLAFVSLENGPPFAFGITIPSSANVIWTWRDIELTRQLVGKDLEQYIDYGWHTQTVDNAEDLIGFSWDEQRKHPNQVAHDAAMDKCCELFSCANGRGPSLTYQEDLDPYWDNGLLWIQRTMQPLTKPTDLVCYLCANDGYGHKLAASRRRYEDFTSNKLDAEERISKAETDLYDAQDELKNYIERITELQQEPLYDKEWNEDES